MDTIGLIEAWQSIIPRANISLEEFLDQVSTWDATPIVVDGQVCGALLVKGSEIHACVLPWASGKWLNRRVLRVLDAVIEQHGEAVTTATTDAGRKFVSALGFVKDGDVYRSNRKWVSKQHSA